MGVVMATQDEINARREIVLKRWLAGDSEENTARALEVSRATVHRDRDALRGEIRERASNLDPFQEIGHAMVLYDEITHQALAESAKAVKPSSKAQLLQTAATALGKKMRLLVDTGLLPRPAHTARGIDEPMIELKGRLVPMRKVSLTELKQLRDDALRRMMDSPEGRKWLLQNQADSQQEDD